MDYKLLLDQMPDSMICTYLEDGSIQYYNRFFEQFFAGDSGEDLVGANIHELLDAGIVDSPQHSYSKKYRDLILENPLQERLHFRVYDMDLGEGIQAKVFHETTQLNMLNQKVDELQKELVPSYSTTDSGAFPSSFLTKELPITYNAYSRTGHSMALVLFEVNHLEDLRVNSSPESAKYVFVETTRLIRNILRRREDFVVEYSATQILICLFNVPIWHPNGSGHKKTVEELVQEIQSAVQHIEIPHNSLRNPMEKVTLNAGVIESIEREALSSLFERAEEALQKSLDPQNPEGHIEISIPTPFF